MIDTKALRQKILDLAIRGKLVEQDSNDEPASLLIARIKAEKEQLIKEKKIKKEKPLPPIKADEIPFQIPNGWEWVRLVDGCLKEIKRGKSPKYIDKSETLVFAQKCNTKYDGIHMELALFLDEINLGKYSEFEFMQNGDTVINSTGTGTLGRVGIFFEEDNPRGLKIVPDSHVTVIRGAKELEPYYVYSFLKLNQSRLEKMGEGTTNQKELKPISIKQLMIPVPPYEEQKRIVAKIEELFAQVDAIEKAQNDLVELKKIAKQKVLDLAIRGKLVEQDPNNEPASLLIARIKAEKEQLIKEKKIKKEKPLPPIKADEIPFQIPNGWEWVRLGDIIQLVSGQDFNSSLYFDEPHEHSVLYITGASNIENNRVIINRWTDTPKSIAIKDDLLIVCKGSVGKTAYLEEEKAHMARQIMAVRMIYGLDRFYIGTAIHAKVDDIVRSQKGIIPGIERSTMLNLAISLPPIKEQKRIVAKIEELFEQIDLIR